MRPTGPGARSTVVASGESLMAGTMSRYSKMRANSAEDVWMSSATRMRPSRGCSSRACTVVNATIVPAVMASVPPVMR